MGSDGVEQNKSWQGDGEMTGDNEEYGDGMKYENGKYRFIS